jgi:hypothetical protein
MSTNPLKKAAKLAEFVSERTALEWARGAREKNLPKHEAAWLAEARRRGEIPDHSEARRVA